MVMTRTMKRRSSTAKRYPLLYDFWTSVDGIPCQAKVVYYNPGQRGDTPSMGPPRSYQSIEAPEDEDLDVELYDRKGYRAKWLEAKLDEDDKHWEQIYEDAERSRREDADEAALARAESLGYI